MVHSDSMPHAEPASPRESVGQLLAATRMRHGVDLPHVADALRIRLSFLQAIEEGRSKDLPGPTYAVGFVRAYADYLGLDGNEIARRYKEESAIVPRKAELEFPTPVNEGGMPTGAILLMAALLGAGIYGGWYWLSSEDRTVAELIQEVPARFEALIATESEEGAPAAPSVVEARAEANAAGQQVAQADAAAAGDQPPISPVVEDPEPVPGPATDADAGQAAQPRGVTEEGEFRQPPTSEAMQDTRQVLNPGTEPGDPLKAGESPEAMTPGPVQSTIRPEPLEPATPPTMPEPRPFEGERQPPEEAPQEAQPEQQSRAPAAAEPVARAAAPEAPRVPEETQVAATPSAGPTVPPPPAPPPRQELAAVPAAPEIPAATTSFTGTVYGAAEGSTRVVLAATEDSWIQVRAGSDLIATRLLRKGERFQVPEQDGLTLMVGNAGGLRIQVDGRTLPPLGGKGEVRRGIALEADRLLTAQ